jgi:ribulose 1,5-bisphosphate synthetase/thiazole synthase
MGILITGLIILGQGRWGGGALISHAEVEDDLAAWLDNLHMNIGEQEAHLETFKHPMLKYHYVTLQKVFKVW